MKPLTPCPHREKPNTPSKIMFQTTPQTLSLFCFFIIFALFTTSICQGTIPQNHESKIRGMFVFGSSLVDNGNNNFLANTLARADYLPYGIDFPLGTTGRFTNGKNIVDILGEKLKIPNFIPPFNDPSTRGSKIVNGVDFASGSSGILDNTGAIAVNVTSLNQQLRNFEKVTLPELEVLLGKNCPEILSEFLFVVGAGNNDFSRNFFLQNDTVDLVTFTNNLTATLSGQIKKLYDLGARKFLIMAAYPNGCSPMAKPGLPKRAGCEDPLNRAARLFNYNLGHLVHAIRMQLPGSHLVMVDTYKIILDIIGNPTSQGFRDVTNSCCEVPEMSEGGTGVLCKSGGTVCTNRSEYVYFDGVHPTEALNLVIGSKAFSSNLKAEVYPFNIEKLSQI